MIKSHLILKTVLVFSFVFRHVSQRLNWEWDPCTLTIGVTWSVWHSMLNLISTSVWFPPEEPPTITRNKNLISTSVWFQPDEPPTITRNKNLISTSVWFPPDEPPTITRNKNLISTSKPIKFKEDKTFSRRANILKSNISKLHTESYSSCDSNARSVQLKCQDYIFLYIWRSSSFILGQIKYNVWHAQCFTSPSWMQ